MSQVKPKLQRLLVSIMRSAAKVLLTALLFAFPVAVDAKDRQKDRHSARQIAESVDLFRAVLHDQQTFSPCLFPSTWGTYLLTSEIRPYLGTRNTLHSRLTKQPPPLDEILIQAGAPKESICTPEQRKQAERAAIATLASRSAETEAGSDLAKLDYNFPIYNARHNKAVIMLTSSAPGWYKRKDGLIYATGFDMSGVLLVYGKRHGKWERLDYDEIFSADFGGQSVPVTPKDWVPSPR